MWPFSLSRKRKEALAREEGERFARAEEREAEAKATAHNQRVYIEAIKRKEEIRLLKRASLLYVGSYGDVHKEAEEVIMGYNNVVFGNSCCPTFIGGSYASGSVLIPVSHGTTQYQTLIGNLDNPSVRESWIGV